MEDLLQVGVITTTHGIRGEVKVYPTTDDVHRFEELESVLLDTGKEYRELKIKSVTISMTLKNIKAKVSLSQEKMHSRLEKMSITSQI